MEGVFSENEDVFLNRKWRVVEQIQAYKWEHTVYQKMGLCYVLGNYFLELGFIPCIHYSVTKPLSYSSMVVCGI